MKTWIEPAPVFVPENLRQFTGGHTLIAETLTRRGVTTVAAAQAFLDPAYYRPASPYDLPEMDRAIERVRRAIQQGERMAVWGDFDVDGQTATALLVSALRDLGAAVDYHIPNRLSEGHGVHIPRLGELIDAGAQVIVTCDTGIAAHEAVDYANGRGVDVVITDHHQLPPVLPEAYARVNPQRLVAGHPLRTLPGVGVAYKLVEALYDGHDTHAYLDLVALGIVADVATLTGDTRYLLQLGLDVLRESTRPGLRAIYERAQLNPDEISEQHISFTLAPRLNALGRLADANPAVELLTSDDPTQVNVLATQLEGFNHERRLQMNQVYGAAKAQIEKDPSLLDDAALVLSHPDWPGGIVGIVASRLAEEYNRPAILLTTPAGEAARGSARSVDGCDITAAIATHSDLLLTYGGHTAAAGLSLDPANLMDFRRELSRTVRGMLGRVEAKPTLAVDGYVKLGALSLDLVRDVERLAPFGPGNPALTLATRGVKINRQTAVGRQSEHLSLMVEDDEGTTHKVLWWQAREDELPQGRFDLAYTVRASDYKGKREVMVEWVDARPADDGLIDLDGGVVEMEAEDYRLVSDPHFILQQLQQEQPDLLIWREVLTDVKGVTRSGLRRSRALAVWTVPPGNTEWQAALQTVLPRTVYLFGHDPGLDTPGAFIKRLGGLVKHVLNAREGLAAIDELAAAMAHRATTIRAGLDWLAAQGSIQIREADGKLHLAPGGTPDAARPHLAEGQLQALLAETAAYRAHWLRASGYNLVRGF